jgi:hypothetical protein
LTIKSPTRPFDAHGYDLVVTRGKARPPRMRQAPSPGPQTRQPASTRDRPVRAVNGAFRSFEA